jgi:hypothetical protein
MTLSSKQDFPPLFMEIVKAPVDKTPVLETAL